jgi:hypothetical protein
MFLLDRRNPYTPIPGLMLEYERVGIDAAHRQLDRISASVLLARQTVREALGMTRFSGSPMTLDAIAAALYDAGGRGKLSVADELAAELIAELAPAIDLIKGDPAYAPPLRREVAAGGAGSGRFVTLTGVSILN